MRIHTEQSKGFTIVELLIVIVVIAILAAITIVSYNGITKQARQSALQSGLKQVATQIATYRAFNNSYPATLNDLNEGRGVETPSDASFSYTQTGDTYCLDITSSEASLSYYISTASPSPQTGSCASVGPSYATRDGYTNLTYSYGSGDTILAPIGSISTGSWMIVILTYFQSADPTPPAGWTTLVNRHTTNTLQTSIYAKIKTGSDAANQEFEAPSSNGRLFVNAVLFWGTKSAPVSSWIVGSFGDRLDNATSNTAVTPTITTTTPKSLVLSIATERTNAIESNYTSLAGATPWIWIPQSNGSDSDAKNQTITVGYTEKATVGPTQAMTVTYPNAQTFNATGIQIAIPPQS